MKRTISIRLETVVEANSVAELDLLAEHLADEAKHAVEYSGEAVVQFVGVVTRKRGQA